MALILPLYCNSLNLYIPDSVSFASLTHQSSSCIMGMGYDFEERKLVFSYMFKLCGTPWRSTSVKFLRKQNTIVPSSSATQEAIWSR